MNLFICYPVRNIGGAQLLLLRIASYLYVHKKIKIHLCDFNDGFIKNELNKLSIEFSFYDINNFNASSLPMDMVFLTPLSEISNYDVNFFPEGMRVLAWAVHPSGVLSFFKMVKLYTKIKPSILNFLITVFEKNKNRKFRLFIDSLHVNNALMCMDAANLNSIINITKKSITTAIVPIAIDVYSSGRLNINIDRVLLEYVWLGRLDNDKIKSLIHVIKTISAMSQKNNFNAVFHVVGYGDKKDYLQGLDFPGVTLIFPGILVGNDLKSYLSEKPVVGFAMGTSVLELVKIGVLTFVVDLFNSTDTVPFQNIYPFALDGRNYLGDISSNSKFLLLEENFVEIINEYSENSLRQYNFLCAKYSIEVVAEEVYFKLISTKFKWHMLGVLS